MGVQGGRLSRLPARRCHGSPTSAARSSRCRTRSRRWGSSTRCRPAGQIAGACNAILLRPDGTLLGDMFDGEGFVRGMLRKGRSSRRASRSSSAAAASARRSRRRSLARASARLGLFDVNAASAEALARPARDALSGARACAVGSKDPAGYEIVVNATPVGMNARRSACRSTSRGSHRRAFVGEVVMKERDHAVPRGRARARLRGPGRHRHAVRADPRLSRVLRLSEHDTR